MSKSSEVFQIQKVPAFWHILFAKRPKTGYFCSCPSASNKTLLESIESMHQINFIYFLKIPIDRDLSISGHSTLDSMNFNFYPITLRFSREISKPSVKGGG